MPLAKASQISGTPVIHGIEAEAGIAPIGPFAHEMQTHHEHEAVGGITVEAAQEAAEIPLIAADLTD